MFADEVAEVALVVGTNRLLVLPLLWHKGPLHVHRLLQEQGQFWAERVYRSKRKV